MYKEKKSNNKVEKKENKGGVFSMNFNTNKQIIIVHKIF